MCALHELRAQTHLGRPAGRWSEWFPPGAPPTSSLIPGPAADRSRDTDVDERHYAAELSPCDCLHGVLHAL